MGKKEKKICKKNNQCHHESFWGLYKILNFHRGCSKFQCKKCKKKISVAFEHHDILKKNICLRLFSGLLWMSPVMLIIISAVFLAGIYSFWSYMIAIFFVTAYHFLALYYIIELKMFTIKIKKFL